MCQEVGEHSRPDIALSFNCLHFKKIDVDPFFESITVAAVIFGPICTLFSDDFGQFSPIFGHLRGKNNKKCLVLLSWDKA